MGNSYKFRSERNAAALFATTVVLTIAVFGALVVGAIAFPRDPGIVWLLGGGGFGLALLVVLLLRERPEGSLRQQFGWMSRKPPTADVDYEPRVIRSEPARFGTNRPPTVEQIRDLKDTDRNWVPSNTPAGRRSQRRK